MLNKALMTAAVLTFTILGPPPQLSRGQNAPEPSQPQLKPSDIDEMMNGLSNWDRWGKEDQRGTLNLITPAKRKQAAGLVREGISVSLAHDFSAERAPDNTRPLEFTMTLTQPVAMEELRIFYHGLTYAHLDALCHARYKGKAYNGFDASLATEKGCARAGIEHLKDGILSRGILIDVPRLKGAPYLEGATPVIARDIEEWEKKAGVRIGAGDVVLVRTGRWAKRAASGPFSLQGGSPGVHVSLLPLLKARDVALLGTDVGLDVTPSGVEGVVIPTHTVAIVGMGLLIVDNADLEALAETAARLNRWEFMFTAAPLPVTGATGSPLNAIATF
jgi:kynurenine formamidase